MGQVISFFFPSNAQTPEEAADDALIGAVLNDINDFDARHLAGMARSRSSMANFDGSLYHPYNRSIASSWDYEEDLSELSDLRI